MVKHAVILAAGRGKRMGDKTLDLPKPMLPVQGKPMLEHVMDRLQAAGVEHFLLVVGYKREIIIEHFGARAEYRVQHTVDGTGSATRLAQDFTREHPFLLTFGDILCEPDVYIRHAEVLRQNPGTCAVLGVRNVDDPWQGAAVYVDSTGRVTKVIEKPAKGTSTTRWNSGGIFLLAPVVYDYLARLQPSIRGEYELTSAFEMMLVDELELRIAAIEGAWRDVGRPEDLAAVNSGPQPADDPNQHDRADHEDG